MHLNESTSNHSTSFKTLDETFVTPPPGISYVQHRSHLLVRSVGPQDSGVYRCDSDLTGEASVQVYVVDQEDLMKSLHLHGAFDKNDLSETLRVNDKELEGRKPSNTYSSFLSRDSEQDSNSFYDHPIKSHSPDYKTPTLNKSDHMGNIWKVSPSSTSSAYLAQCSMSPSRLTLWMALLILRRM